MSIILNTHCFFFKKKVGTRPELVHIQSRSFLSMDDQPQPIEFFLASDASAIVEHTKSVIYLEDGDIAHIADGGK